MFTIDTTVDAVQNSKKQMINTFVTNENVKEALNNFVDAQSEYTKAAFKAGQDTFTTVAQEITKSLSEAAKFDYTKMADVFKTKTSK